MTRSPRSVDVGLSTVAAVAGVAVAVSPALTWFRGTPSRRRTWSGFGLFADREVLGIEGNPLMLGFDDGDWYNSAFGPAAPMAVGLVLVLGGLAAIRRRPRVMPTWIAPAVAVTALWSVGAAGITGGSGVRSGGDVGGAGICVWAIGSAVGALAFGAKAARDRPPLSSSAVAGAIVDWAALPAILLGGAFGALLTGAEEVQPFATWLVLLAATLAAVFPAAAMVTALLAITPPGRPLGVTVLNTSALVLGGLLFALWAVAACHAGTGQIETGVPGQRDSAPATQDTTTALNHDCSGDKVHNLGTGESACAPDIRSIALSGSVDHVSWMRV